MIIKDAQAEALGRALFSRIDWTTPPETHIISHDHDGTVRVVHEFHKGRPEAYANVIEILPDGSKQCTMSKFSPGDRVMRTNAADLQLHDLVFTVDELEVKDGKLIYWLKIEGEDARYGGVEQRFLQRAPAVSA